MRRRDKRSKKREAEQDGAELMRPVGPRVPDRPRPRAAGRSRATGPRPTPGRGPPADPVPHVPDRPPATCP